MMLEDLEDNDVAGSSYMVPQHQEHHSEHHHEQHQRSVNHFDIRNHAMVVTGPHVEDHRSYIQRPVTTIRRPIYTPYLNQPVLPTATKKRYIIAAPRPGQQLKEFPGLDFIHKVRKRVTQERRVTIVPAVEESLQHEPTLLMSQPLSRPRYLLRIPKREPMADNDMRSLKQPVDNDMVRWNVAPEVTYSCSEHDCFWRGPTQAALTRHLKQRHPEQIAMVETASKRGNGRAAGVRCSECDDLIYSRALLLKHMGTTHGISIPPFSRIFQYERELADWLNDVRDAFCVDYVTGSGPKMWTSGARITYLVCSRNGDQKERPTKKFCRPARKSIKCGKTCTAYLKMRRGEADDPNGPFTVEGCLFHTGHNIDPKRMRLTGEEMDAVYRVAERYGELCPLDSVQVREILGLNASRFRLIEDQALMEILPEWCKMVLDIGWKYKMGQRTDADLLADTMICTNHMAGSISTHTMSATLPAPGSFQREPSPYNYTLLDDEILHYDSAASEDGSINVTDDLKL